METIHRNDASIINFFQQISIPMARIAIFVVFFWFGILKVIGLSPAGAIVHNLFDQTLSGLMSFNSFYIFFALFECLIGILFLIPKAERIVLPLLLFHMVTTFLPLIFLASETWSGPFVPTLEGQYIIKNLVIIAAAIGIAAHLNPLSKKYHSDITTD
jgi:uncharacterized membrane protein YkgB